MSLNSATLDATWRTRLVALVWGIGSIEHAVGLVGLSFGWQLLAFLGEQVATNGVEAWQAWAASHRVEWPIVLTLPFIAVAVVAVHPAFHARSRPVLPPM
jgi:hypothetical protein